MLLRELSTLELRLVATHPGGHGGRAFVGPYPNAFATLIFVVSCVLGAALAQELRAGDLAPATFGYVICLEPPSSLSLSDANDNRQ